MCRIHYLNGEQNFHSLAQNSDNPNYALCGKELLAATAKQLCITNSVLLQLVQFLGFTKACCFCLMLRFSTLLCFMYVFLVVLSSFASISQLP